MNGKVAKRLRKLALVQATCSPGYMQNKRKGNIFNVPDYPPAVYKNLKKEYKHGN